MFGNSKVNHTVKTSKFFWRFEGQMCIKRIVVTSNIVIWSLDSGIIFFRATDSPEWGVSDAWFWLLSKRCFRASTVGSSVDASTTVWEPEKSFSFPSHDINHSTKLLLSPLRLWKKFCVFIGRKGVDFRAPPQKFGRYLAQIFIPRFSFGPQLIF